MKHLILVILLLVMGCAKPASQSQTTRMDLASIAMQYHQYVSEVKSPPSSVELLADFSDPYAGLPGNSSTSTAMKNALASGDYVVYWGYDVTADLARNGSVVLAYHKDVPSQGGFVAFADGMVRNLTKKEFEATSKADAMSE